MWSLVTIALFVITCKSEELNENPNTCADGDNIIPSFSHKPIPGRIKARNQIKWCPELVDDMLVSYNQTAVISTHYINVTTPDKICNDSTLLKEFTSKLHSVFSVTIDRNLLAQCNYTCFIANLDMMATGCYYVRTQLNDKMDKPHYVSINNDFSQFSNFTKHSSEVSLNVFKSSGVSLEWTFFYIPLTPTTAYRVEVTCWNGTCSNSEIIEPNCTIVNETNSLVCKNLPLESGCYILEVIFDTRVNSWATGSLVPEAIHHIYTTCLSVPGLDQDAPGGAEGAAGAGALAAAALCVALCALCALGALWRRRARLVNIWKTCTSKGQNDPGEGNTELGASKKDKEESGLIDSGRPATASDFPADTVSGASSLSRASSVSDVNEDEILLLYAEDHPLLMEAADVLAQLLQALGPRVLDINSADVRAEAAASYQSWVQRKLSRPRCATLVLVTPCLRGAGGARWAARGGDDQLLRYALRLLQCDAPLRPDQYKRCYIAQVESEVREENKKEEAELEEIRTLTPLRRYPLPSGVELLLQHAAGVDDGALQPLRPLLRSFALTLQRYRVLVAAQPDYYLDYVELLDRDLP